MREYWFHDRPLPTKLLRTPSPFWRTATIYIRIAYACGDPLSPFGMNVELQVTGIPANIHSRPLCTVRYYVQIVRVEPWRFKRGVASVGVRHRKSVHGFSGREHGNAFAEGRPRTRCNPRGESNAKRYLPPPPCGDWHCDKEVCVPDLFISEVYSHQPTS